MDVANELIGKFGERMGIPGLSVDEEAYCQMSLDEELLVVFKFEKEEDDFEIL